ncbi:hypothetical protein DKX38_028113 [Salix brachista]|uniref:Uncharacterized protein n=1 Tax=Salix brachista TaxID=2182728 RepID=A0A5N5JGG7_9ROSI|nr:hypothetical protein DKX38_028113 [Salix brachista]
MLREAFLPYLVHVIGSNVIEIKKSVRNSCLQMKYQVRYNELDSWRRLDVQRMPAPEFQKTGNVPDLRVPKAHNYASRSSCYSCGASKSNHEAGGYGSNAYASDGSDRPGWKAGDWFCTSIRNMHSRDVESIIMLAGWNALDAEHPGNTVVDIDENDLLLTAYGPVFSAITFQF